MRYGVYRRRCTRLVLDPICIWCLLGHIEADLIVYSKSWQRGLGLHEHHVTPA